MSESPTASPAVEAKPAKLPPLKPPTRPIPQDVRITGIDIEIGDILASGLKVAIGIIPGLLLFMFFAFIGAAMLPAMFR